MKRTPLVLAALLPFIATAGQSGGQPIDYNELRDDLQVTTLLGTNVQSNDGQDIGSIEDVMISADGAASVIIQREGDFGESVEQTGAAVERGAERTGEAVERGAERTRDATQRVAGTEEERAQTSGTAEGTTGGESVDQGLDPDRAGSTEAGDDFVKVDWRQIEYNAAEDVATLKGGMQDAQPVAYEQTADISMQQDARASMLIGMEVNLADEDSFGEVEDVMLDPASGKASALVIDSMEFFDKERYAVPVSLDAVNAEEEELTLQYSKKQLEDMGEFRMEEETADQN